MRFVKVRTTTGPRVGVLGTEGSISISRAAENLEPYFGDDGNDLQELGRSILADPDQVVAMDEAVLLAPIVPTSVRDFMVFEEHVLPAWRNLPGWEQDRLPDVWYEQPLGYFSNAETILGPRDSMELPGGSEKVDFELEIAAVVGREARSITPEEAGPYIAGYVILCDWSARDTQLREMDGRLGPFKGKDFASSLGPVFITPDELDGRRMGKGYDIKMTAKVNGKEYGSDSWASAYWSFEEILSFASWNSVVEAGALLGSGTCQGGCILELSLRHGPENYQFLNAGDEVTLSVDLMDEIRATVAPATRSAWPGALEQPDDFMNDSMQGFE